MTGPQETHFNVVIAGGGTAGCALAGLIAQDSDISVCLIEAGPDYGPFDGGTWPSELLDAVRLPRDSHSWGYQGVAHSSQSERIPFDRARVIGGCSAHNGCIALLGHYRDYDHWVNIGNLGWSWGSVRPSFLRAMERLRVRQPEPDESTPYQALFLGGSIAAGIPQVRDLNNPSETSGVALAPVNIADGVRWNTALAYLDQVRGQDNLTILADCLVDRLVIDGTRVVGVQCIQDGNPMTIGGDRIVLSAGAYGSPGILERSGIGDPAILEPLGITVRHALPGVGKKLADHPTVSLIYQGSDDLNREMDVVTDGGWCPDEQALVKTTSPACDDAFDLHLFSVSQRDSESGDWIYTVHVSSVLPTSNGTVHITSNDPDQAPDIDHGYLTDAEGRDLAVLHHGVKLARSIMEPAIESGMLDSEVTPGPDVETDHAIRDFIEQSVGIYYHPGCACHMGHSMDSDAVVDSLGRIHGLDGVWICDASIFPTLMRANTNLPTVMMAEHLAPVIRAGR